MFFNTDETPEVLVNNFVTAEEGEEETKKVEEAPNMKNFHFGDGELEFKDDMDDQPDNTYISPQLAESGQILITDDQPTDAKDP